MSRNRKPIAPIFKFDSDELRMNMDYDMNLFARASKPLGYIMEILEKTGHGLTIKSLDNPQIEKVKLQKGKSYNWGVISYENFKFLIRVYGYHLTIFIRSSKPCDYREGKMVHHDAAFSIYAELDRMDGDKRDEISEGYYDNPFQDLNVMFKRMIEYLKEDNFHCFWNDVSIPRPKHVEIKQAYEKKSSFMGEARIFSYDLTIFCMEEIDSMHCQLFAENTMFDKLKELKVGQPFGSRSTIKEIRSKLKDGYYHGVGVTAVNEDGKEDWSDVYSLTRWHYDEVFPKEEEKKE